MKLLLTSVFGPFGVDDDYGKKENKMELFHNQVTREQGIFSYRFNHNSFGLYLLAENIKVPTAVLDFPKMKRFIAELKNIRENPAEFFEWLFYQAKDKKTNEKDFGVGGYGFWERKNIK